MTRKWIAVLLLLIFPGNAFAEVFEGVTAASSTIIVQSSVSGKLDKVNAQVGEHINAGDAIAHVQSEKTFATQDGTVALINAKEGESLSGTELELFPLEQYQVYSTVNKAYQSAESTLVHNGEIVYIKCTADGTHRAIGIITKIDGEEYRVITIGGELYIGETVYLYRDEAFTASQRIGIGTVVNNDMESYEANGEITRLCVVEGDYVERGQLLFETNGGDILAPISGILSAISLQPGDDIAEDQRVFEIIPESDICVEVRIGEEALSRFATGGAVQLLFASGDEEHAINGTVIDISNVMNEGMYTVTIQPEKTMNMYLGMSVLVRI